MAKTRLIPGPINTCDKFGAVSTSAECLYCRLLLLTDDYGNVLGGYGFIKDQCFPRKKDAGHRNNSVSYTDVEACATELKEAGLIVEYEADGVAYFHFLNFQETQKLRPDRMTKEYPDFPGKPISQPNRRESATNPQPSGNQTAARVGACRADDKRVLNTLKQDTGTNTVSSKKRVVSCLNGKNLERKLGKLVHAEFVRKMKTGKKVIEFSTWKLGILRNWERGSLGNVQIEARLAAHRKSIADSWSLRAKMRVSRLQGEIEAKELSEQKIMIKKFLEKPKPEREEIEIMTNALYMLEFPECDAKYLPPVTANPKFRQVFERITSKAWGK